MEKNKLRIKSLLFSAQKSICECLNNVKKKKKKVLIASNKQNTETFSFIFVLFC